MTASPFRIAFLTPEFVTELRNSGGIASYLSRMTRALKEAEHEPEIFTLSKHGPEVLDYDGIRVERVQMPKERWSTLIGRVSWSLWRTWPWESIWELRGARVLACAFRRRHRENPFDLLQSSDYRASGLFVGTPKGCWHVVRCSWARNMFKDIDREDILPGDRRPLDEWLTSKLETWAARRAHQAYAPSQFVADYFSSRFGLKLGVVRPPFFRESEPAETVGLSLPERYLVHFGQLCRRKGTDLVARALKLALEEEPGLTVVWCGPERLGFSVERSKTELGESAHHIVWTGALERPLLFGVVSGAVASVLPSRVDNLPNTVIESLLYRVPVIGSFGASIDEMVEDGRNGILVPIGDVEALAQAMVSAWRGELTWSGNEGEQPKIMDEMQPQNAVQALLSFAGLC